jgi:hypothetical protein
MNEIKINTPGKPFIFILNSNGEYGGTLYFKGKIVDPATMPNPDHSDYYMIDLNNYRMENPDYDPDIEKYIIKAIRPSIYPVIDEKYVEVRSSIEEIKILTPGKPFKFVLDGDSEDWGKLYFRDELIDGYTSTSDRYPGHYMLNRRYQEGANYNPEAEQYFSKDPEISQFTYIMIPKKYVEVRSSIEEIKVQNPEIALFNAIYSEIKRIAKINPLALNNEIQDILDRYGWMKFIEKHMWAPHALEDFLKSLPHEAIIDIYSSFRNIGAPLDEIKIISPETKFVISMFEEDDEDNEEYGSYPEGEIVEPSFLKNLQFSDIDNSTFQTYFADITREDSRELYSKLIEYLKYSNIPYKEKEARNSRHIDIPSKYFKEISSLDEIKVKLPGKPFRFKSTETDSYGHRWGELYFKGKLIDESTTLSYPRHPDAFMIDSDYFKSPDYDPEIESYVFRTSDIKDFPMVERTYVVEEDMPINEIKINSPENYLDRIKELIKNVTDANLWEVHNILDILDSFGFAKFKEEFPYGNAYAEWVKTLSSSTLRDIYKELLETFPSESIDEIKVTSPDKPFTFSKIFQGVFGNPLGSLYFKNHLIDDGVVYKANKNTMMVYMDPSLYMNLADKLEPYLDSEAEHALTLAGSKVIFTIKDSYVRFEKSIDEIKVEKPKLNFTFPFTVKNKSDIPHIIKQLNDQGYTRKGHKFEETDLLFNIPAILDYDSNYDPERKILNTFSPMEEIKVEKPNEFYDLLDSGGDIDIENVIKNIKKFKSQIADTLDITDTERLNKFLTHYANAVLETADFGDADLYENLTLEEFINDIEALYDTSHEGNWEYDLEYDRIKPQDIQEIKVVTPGKPLKFVVTKRINNVLQGSVYFKDILLDNTATKLDEESTLIHVHIAPDLFNEVKYEFPEDLVEQFRNWGGDAYKANLNYSRYFG